MSYKFSLEFQKHILASVIADHKFLQENSDVIRPEYFGDEILAGIAQGALDFFGKHKESPTKVGLKQELKSIVAPGRKLHEYIDELEGVYQLVGINSLYYQTQASEFARSQAVSGAVRAAIPLIEQGDIEEVGRMVSEALKIGSGGDSSGLYDYFGMAPDRIRHYLNGHAKEDRLGTGLTSLDDCMGGGLGKGELGTIVALPGHGKSTTLVNIGARALLQNKRVVHFTLELSKRMIATKYDSALFGRTIDRIRDAPKEFALALKEMRDKITGKLVIGEFPTKGLTVDRMSTIVQKVGKVDLVLVDYGQLVKAPTKREQRRHELSEVYEGMRRMAGELQIPVWTAHQANRPGTQSRVILPEHIAEDFNVIAISDIVVSVNHNEEEMRQGAMRLYIMKSRIGPSGMQIDCRVNWKLCKISLA